MQLYFYNPKTTQLTEWKRANSGGGTSIWSNMAPWVVVLAKTKQEALERVNSSHFSRTLSTPELVNEFIAAYKARNLRTGGVWGGRPYWSKGSKRYVSTEQFMEDWLNASR